MADNKLFQWQFFFQTIYENERTFIDYFCFIILLNGIISYLVLMNGCQSAYGRYSDTKTYGFPMPAKLAWFLMELPSCVIPFICIYASSSSFVYMSTSAILLFFFLTHYVQRTFLYSWMIRGGKPTPVILFILGTGFQVLNSYIQSRLLIAYAVSTTFLSAHFVLGMLAAVIGLLINIHSDHILRNLRKPNESGYKIPRGGLFEYVSCANFFGEILEWWGFALAAWNFGAVTLAAFSFLNLYPRAYQHHRFYQKKFEDYPKDRRILIPYVL